MTRTYYQSIVLVLLSYMLCMNIVYGKSYCGSTLMQKIGVPEYVCFGLAGTLPYAGCAVGRVTGYKPVHFGEACRAHDDCYSLNGISKEYCDRQFLTLMQNTCDTTLTGKYRKIARKNCYNVASEYYYQVSSKGHEAFANAQRLSRQRNQTSGSRESLRQKKYGREPDEEINEVDRDLEDGRIKAERDLEEGRVEAARDFERGVNEAARDFQRGVNEAAAEWK